MKKKIIYRHSGEPYLVRRYLFRCPWFQVCLHHILLSDYDCLHDHPWGFISYIFRGGYWERTPLYPNTFEAGSRMQIPELMSTKRTWYGPFTLLFRGAKYKHSIELPAGKTAWSIVIMFQKKRGWGFWTKQGFQDHAIYDAKQTCE